MSTIYLDVVKLEKPIMFHPKSREQYWPQDSQYHRLLREAGISEKDLEKCFHAIRLMDASGCTMLDPFPTYEAAIDWIRENLFKPHVFIDGNLRRYKKELEKAIGKIIPQNKVYGWKERVALEKQIEPKKNKLQRDLNK